MRKETQFTLNCHQKGKRDIEERETHTHTQTGRKIEKEIEMNSP